MERMRRNGEPRERILLVDQDVIDRRTAIRYLAVEKRYDFVEVESIAAAIEALSSERFACVLLEFHLADGDAFAFLRHLSQLRKPPVAIVLTGVDADHRAVKLLEHGAEDYLPKDQLSRRTLCQAVEFGLARQRSPGRRRTRRPPLATVPASGLLTGNWVETFTGEIRGYQIEGRLGSGAMAAVFEATQCSLQRKVAIKVLAPLLARDKEMMERFKQEAFILAGFDSPFFVPIFDLFSHRGYTCIVMAFAAGGSVEALLKRHGRLPLRRALTIARDCALGLQVAARAGIVHRDVKPANILLSSTGQAKIADFGLAKLSRNAALNTAPGIVFGSAAYMAPEQWSDELPKDPRSDLYALGCTLFELLTGDVPFPTQSSADAMREHLHTPPPRVSSHRPEVPRRVEEVVVKLLAKEPEHRFHAGSEVARALQLCLQEVGG